MAVEGELRRVDVLSYSREESTCQRVSTTFFFLNSLRLDLIFNYPLNPATLLQARHIPGT